MDHSFPEANLPQHPKADGVCQFARSSLRISQAPFPHECDTYKQHEPKYDVFAPRLRPPSHSDFTVVMSTLSRLMLFTKICGWDSPTSLEDEQNVPGQQRRLPHLHLFFNSIPAPISRSPTPTSESESQCGDPSGDSFPDHSNVTTEMTG